MVILHKLLMIDPDFSALCGLLLKSDLHTLLNYNYDVNQPIISGPSILLTLQASLTSFYFQRMNSWTWTKFLSIIIFWTNG